MAEGNGKELNTKATVAGGGAGTLLVVLANRIATSEPTLATLLMYAAPGFSVGAAALWVVLAHYAGSVRNRWVTDRALKRAREMRDKVCADPEATDPHKAHVRAAVEKFEKLSMAMIADEFESVDVKIVP